MIHFQKSIPSRLETLIANAREARKKVWELRFSNDWKEINKRDKALTSLLAEIAKYKDQSVTVI